MRFLAPRCAAASCALIVSAMTPYFTPTFYRARKLGDLEFMFASQLN
jgi:hypothetical protein